MSRWFWKGWSKCRDMPSERRQSPRYPVDGACGELGWWCGPRFDVTRATVIDLSTHGALIVADEGPPEPVTTLWLHVEAAGSADWIEVLPIQRQLTPRQLYVLRVRFRHHCPYAVFRALVRGVDFSGCHEAPRDPHAELWR